MQPPINILDPILIADRWQLKTSIINLISSAQTIAEANPRRVLLCIHNPNTSLVVFVGVTTDVTSNFGWQLGGSSVPADYTFDYARYGGLVGLQWYGANPGGGQQIMVNELIYLPLGS